MSKLQELFSYFGSVRVRQYSGRGMFGRQCLAITGSTSECKHAISEVVQSLTQEIFDAAIDAVDDTEVDQAHEFNDETQLLIAKLLSFDMDSMGLDVVYYWPRIEFVDEEELDDDE